MKRKPTQFTAIAIAFFCLYSFNLKAQVNLQDSLALVTLYDSTNGPGWTNHTNWLTTNPVSTWAGITVTNNRVTEVIVGANNLQGGIPSALGDLTAATLISMGNNYLSGSIPASLGNLNSLETLALEFNQLSGEIPASLGNLPSIIYLDLYVNQLTGTVPASFINLTTLRWLDIQNNNLSGGIPLTVCNMTWLQVLKLEHNQFTGSIPAAIGRLVNVVVMDLSFNQLSGSIPDSIFMLPLLGELHLQNNQLSGRLPVFQLNIPKLQTLELENNQLSSSIPASIQNLNGLTYLDMSGNKLSGNIPNTIRALSGLGTLNVSSNQLTYIRNDFSAGWFPFLRTLDFRTNKFTFTGIESIAQNFQYKFTYSPQTNIAVHQHGNKLAVNAGGTLSNNTYTWFEVGKSGTTIISGDSVFQPAESGNYYAKVKNSIATKLTLNTDTIAFTMPLTANSTGALMQKENAFAVYPNPVKDELHVQLNGSAYVTIVDASGRTKLAKQINGNATINVSAFASGTYYIKNNNTNESKQFEVQQ